MKLLLIAPQWERKIKEQRVKRGRVFKIPPLSLLLLASLTPPEFEIEIVDENVEEINFDDPAELVGITCMTASAPRAYEIAGEFRKRGKTVILGGIHPTILPEEASLHADAIVVGEAEGVWEKVLEDWLSGGKKKLKKIYKNNGRPNLSQVPFPRGSLIKRKYLFSRIIQISRGCPFNCSFCSVSRIFGQSYRFRPVEKVVEEIKKAAGEGSVKRFFIFLDDNIMGNHAYSKRLFSALIPLKIKWVGQASLSSAQDKELVKLAAKSGCKGLFIGFESISPSALKEVRKFHNRIEFYREAVKSLHRAGICIEGAFIFGFDDDTPEVFKKTVEFIEELKLEAVQFGILTPFPGTPLWEKLRKENRIIDFNWSNYDIAHVVFQPKNFTPEELREGFLWAYRRIYSLPSILKRLSGVLKDIKRAKYLWVILFLNLAYRKMFKK